MAANISNWRRCRSPARRGFELRADQGRDSVERLRKASNETGIPLSGICIGANFIGDDRRAQIDRAKRYVELCGPTRRSLPTP